MTPAAQAAEQTFESVSKSVPAARRFLTSHLEDWAKDGLVWDGQQILAELVTNAVLHAGGAELTVRIALLADGGLRIEVRDPSPRAPRRRHFDADAATGRGLSLVAALARLWGCERVEGGKVVWCEVAPDPDLGAEPLHAIPEPRDLSATVREAGPARSAARAALARVA